MTSSTTTPPSMSVYSLPRLSWIIKSVFWPFVAILLFHRIFIFPFNEVKNINTDFDTIWDGLAKFNSGQPIYDFDPKSTDPHYLYTPGGTLILSPFEFFSNNLHTETLYYILSAVALVCTVLIFFKLYRVSLKSPVFPVVLTIILASEYTLTNFGKGNINTFVLLMVAGFVYFLVTEKTTQSQIFSGLLLGLVALLKPMFIPLLILFFFRKYWWAILTSLLTFIIPNLIGYSMLAQAEDYKNNLIPYLSVPRDYANPSIAGVSLFFRVGPKAEYALRALVIIVVGLATFALVHWIKTDILFWAVTSVGIIMTGVFLASTLGQIYYTIFLVPLGLTVLSKTRSVAWNPVFWFGMALISVPADWLTTTPRYLNSIFVMVYPTVAWMIILLSSVTTVLYLYYSEKKSDKDTHENQIKELAETEEAVEALEAHVEQNMTA